MASIVSRGFTGRRDPEAHRLPPGQYRTVGFPVLSAGHTPHVDLTSEWRFSVRNVAGQERSWDWRAFQELPQEELTRDIHCVTGWSKFDTVWRGVSVDTLLSGLELDGAWVMAGCYGGYTTNMPLADLTGGRAWVVHEFEGAPLDPAHGGPARLLVPHLYFWKSAKWVASLQLLEQDRRGFWEDNGYHMRGDPWREERYS